MLTSSGPELAVFHQMASREGGRRGSRHAASGPLSEHGVVPWATHMRAYEDGDGVHIKGVGAVPKGTPHPLLFPRDPGAARSVTQRTVRTVANKQGRVLVERINVGTEHAKHSESRDRFLTRVQKNGQKKKEAREKSAGLSRSARPRARPSRRRHCAGAWLQGPWPWGAGPGALGGTRGGGAWPRGPLPLTE